MQKTPNRSLFILILSLCFLLVLTKLPLLSTSETEILMYNEADVKDEFEIEKMMERKTGDKERRVVVGILA